jgi:cation diffusion facilitator CzcD-associated flavoprotein CzcO
MGSQSVVRKTRPDTAAAFDGIVIGAGVSGIYQFYTPRELGLKARVFETGTGVAARRFPCDRARNSRNRRRSWIFWPA